VTLLSICQNTAKEIGITSPSTIAGNTNATAVRLLALANRTGTSLAKKQWEELIKTHSFSTSASEPQYSLPSDYRAMVNDTAWNQTTNQQIFMISPQRWSYEKSSGVSAYQDRYRLLGDDSGPSIGGKFTIHPTPTAVETIYYQYYSKNWATDSGGSTEKSAFTVDNDVPILDEDMFTMGVIWRMLKSLGQPYQEERAEYDQLVEITMANSGGTEKLHADGNYPTLSNIPETGFG